MIFIEGADLTGKTTLAARLAVELSYPGLPNLETISLGRPTAAKRHWDSLVESLAPSGEQRIYDRACIGSVVYGAIMADKHNKNSVTRQELLKFQDYVRETKSMLIVARCNKFEMAQRYLERGDNYVDFVRIMDAAKVYDEYVEQAKGLVQRYNSSDRHADYNLFYLKRPLLEEAIKGPGIQLELEAYHRLVSP